MAASSVCRSGLLPVVARCHSHRPQGSSTCAPAASGPLHPPRQSESRSLAAEPQRWVSGAVFAASAAAALSLSSLTPVVHALEDGLSAYNSPANIGIAIAIPIPDPDQWVFSEYGFIAPLPGRGREDVRSMTFEAYGGCPAWQVMEFERVVPDHGHKKPFPRRGGQWPASLSADEAAPIVVIADGGEDGNQDFSFYPHLEDVLEEMSGLGALACFTL